MNEDMNKILGENYKAVTIAGKEYKITPLTSRKLIGATQSLAFLKDARSKGWLEVISDNGDKAVEFLSAATEVSKDDLLDCALVDLVDLADVVMELNEDFFLRIIEVKEKWKDKLHGQKSSNTSLKKVTNLKP